MKTDKLACCPDLSDAPTCDRLDFNYRLTHFASVRLNDRLLRIPVEVMLQMELERCSGPLSLGDVVYTNTLLPGEKVRLFSMDRRSRFTFDAESQLSYRHEHTAEEQYYMNSMDRFMTDLQSTDEIDKDTSSSGSFSSRASASGAIETFLVGPSGSVSGSYNASSSLDFLREIRVHAESSHSRSVEASRTLNTVSIGEVQTRQHAEGESEHQIESSTRTIANHNQCHAVTYIFYRLNKEQSIRFRLKAIKVRVKDDAADTAAITRAPKVDNQVQVIPNGVLATSSKRAEVQTKATTATIDARLFASTDINLARRASVPLQQEPLDEQVRQQAEKAVISDLAKAGLMKANGQADDKLVQEISFELTTHLPTPGIIVKGCIDTCDVCEPALKRKIDLQLKHRELQNRLLERQIELLEQSQEYRCCPVGEAEEEEETEPEA